MQFVTPLFLSLSMLLSVFIMFNTSTTEIAVLRDIGMICFLGFLLVSVNN